MIIRLNGNVSYPITLDASVWIFDERKILFEDAFKQQTTEVKKIDHARQTAERLNKAYEPKIRKHINRNLNKQEREQALNNSYVMPIKPFLNHAEPKSSAKNAKLKTSNGIFEITLNDLQESLLLFSNNGKPLTDNGPVHLYFKDESNKENPIKAITQITVE